jgi:serine protease
MLFAGATTAAAAAGGVRAQAKIFRPVGQGPSPAGPRSAAASSTNLTYSGGHVFTSPRVFAIYWGPQWSSGFSTGGFSSSQAQTYLNTFLGGVGASPWLQSTAQYCQNVAVGSQFCSGDPNAQLVTNPRGQLAGTWVDTASVPSSPTDAQVQSEAQRGASHFGYDANALYMVLTPTGHSISGFGTQFCAYHDNTTFSGRPLAYANMPYQPDAGASCGMNFVNGANDSFGHGFFDGLSIVAGHEYAETITDAFPSVTIGWLDSSGFENGDKCAWGQGPGPDSASQNVTLGSQFYAVQSLWSNLANGSTGGCVIRS